MTELHEDLKATRDPAGVLRDQFDRTANDCRVSADIAADAATQLRQLACLLTDRTLILSRMGSGDRQTKRLLTSAHVFDRVAVRDASFAAELEAAVGDGSSGRVVVGPFHRRPPSGGAAA